MDASGRDGGTGASRGDGARRSVRVRLVWVTLAGLAPAACSRDPAPDTRAHAPTVLQAWAHAGREAERDTLERQVARFNAARTNLQVELTLLPEGSYNAQVQASALAGDLPDLLEFDGPFVYNYVWQGRLLPIGDRLSAGLTNRILSTLLEQGMYRGELYSLGMYDSGLGLYGRRSRLEAAGARIPTHPTNAWSAAEFDRILADLAESDPDGSVLDLKLNYRGEWTTFAFSPPIQSAGGDLIDRADFQSADGALNGAEAVRALRWFQQWIDDKKYVDANVDDNAFVGGRVALSWVGHWEYRRYRAAFSNDLVLLPLPDFGRGSRTGQGSWNWGVTRKCPRPDAAVDFLEFLLEDRQVLEMADANAAVPGTRGAIERSDLYGEGSPLRLFVTQLAGGFAVPRPRTPAYPVITSIFQQAFADIRNGADIRTALDQAVAEIDQDIEDNQGYPPAP